MRKKSHKAAKKKTDLLPEYDFAGGVRGKYARRFAKGSNVVVLSPDVAEVFPTSESVNRALRACREIVRAAPKAGKEK